MTTTSAKRLYDISLLTEDSELRARLLDAAVRVAIAPGIEPTGGISEEAVDPITVLSEDKDKIDEFLKSLPPKDPAMVAATNIATSISAVIRHIDAMLQAVGAYEEGKDEADEGLTDFQTSLENVRTAVEAYAPWSEELMGMASQIQPDDAPKFPKMPATVLPAPSADEDKLPVIVDGEEEEVEEEPTEDEEFAEEDEEVTEEEEEPSIDDLLSELEGDEE